MNLHILCGLHHYWKPDVCRVPKALPSAQYRALGKITICRVPELCRVLATWHSAKPHFAECLNQDTRQTVSRAPHTPAHARYNGAAVILCRVPHSVHSAKTITCAAHDRYTVATLLPRTLHCAKTFTVMICRVPGWGHSAKLSVPSARCPALGKAL